MAKIDGQARFNALPYSEISALLAARFKLK